MQRRACRLEEGSLHCPSNRCFTAEYGRQLEWSDTRGRLLWVDRASPDVEEGWQPFSFACRGRGFLFSLLIKSSVRASGKRQHTFSVWASTVA